VAEREAAARRAALAYEDAEVVVEVVRAAELAGAPAAASAPPPLAGVRRPAPRGASSRARARAGERKSKRARKGRAPLRVSAAHTLWDLKLRVLEALDVHPANAEVHAWQRGAWAALGPDDATLAGAPGARFPPRAAGPAGRQGGVPAVLAG